MDNATVYVKPHPSYKITRIYDSTAYNYAVWVYQPWHPYADIGGWVRRNAFIQKDAALLWIKDQTDTTNTLYFDHKGNQIHGS